MSTVPQSSQDSLPVCQHVYSVVAMLTLCKQCMFRHKTDRVTHRSVCDVSHPLRDQLGWRWHSHVTNFIDSSVPQIHVWYPPSHPDATHLCMYVPDDSTGQPNAGVSTSVYLRDKLEINYLVQSSSHRAKSTKVALPASHLNWSGACSEILQGN